MERKNPENYQLEDFITDESFINYIFQLNDDDKLYWEHWLKENPFSHTSVQRAREMLQTFSLRISDDEYEEELKKIKKVIAYDQPGIKVKKEGIVRLLNWNKTKRVFKKKKNRFLAFFIPTLLLFFAFGYFLSGYFSKQEFHLTEKYNHSNAPIVLTLSDSTIVTLAPESVLRYPEIFNYDERKVYLNGEAQFHVKRDVTHPFKVYSGKVIATVLGTIFNIKQQHGDSTILIELIKGKLKVDATDSNGISTQSIILNPDERVIYKGDHQRLYKETWQPDNVKTETANHLLFNKDNFESIANRLNNVFNVIIINQSEKKDWLFTGEFRNSTAKEIVENICIIKKLHYQVQGDTIFIR